MAEQAQMPTEAEALRLLSEKLGHAEIKVTYEPNLVDYMLAGAAVVGVGTFVYQVIKD